MNGWLEQVMMRIIYVCVWWWRGVVDPLCVYVYICFSSFGTVCLELLALHMWKHGRRPSLNSLHLSLRLIEKV